MTENRYDAIVVGARCAGSPTAMLLARKGYRVLRRRPGDASRATPSPPTSCTRRASPRCGAGACSTASSATGCPPIHTYAFDFGPFTLAGAPGTARRPGRLRPAPDGARQAARRRRGRGRRRGARRLHRRGACSSRTAGSPASAGHGKGGATVTERARVVVGADGRALAASPRRSGPSSTTRSRRCCAATTPTGAALPMDGRFEIYIRADRGFAACADQRRSDPGHRRLAVSPSSRRTRTDIEGNYLQDVRARAGVRRAPPRRPSARRGSPARPCRTSSASPTARAGRWSATPATTRTSSPRRASPTPSGTPSCAPPRWTRRCPARAPSTRRWPTTRPRATSRCCRCTSSPCELATLEPPPPELQQLLGARPRQPGGDGRLRAGQRRGDVAGRVLLRGERRPHLRNPGATGELREGRARRSS